MSRLSQALVFVSLTLTLAIVINGPNTVPESVDWDPVWERALLGGVANSTIFSVNLQGAISPFYSAPSLFSGIFGIQVDAVRNQVFFVNGSFPPSGDLSALFCVDLNGTLKWMTPLGGLVQATEIALNDIAVDTEGNAYVTDAMNAAIYKVNTSGTPSLFLQNTTLFPNGPPYGFNVDGIDFFPGGDWFVVSLFNTDGKLFTVKLATKEIHELEIVGAMISAPDGIVFSPDGTRLVITNSVDGKLQTLRSLDGWRTAYVVNSLDTVPACSTPAGQWFGSRYFAVCNNFFQGPSSLMEINFPMDNFIGTLEDLDTDWENFTCVPSMGEGQIGGNLAIYQCYWRDMTSMAYGHASVKVNVYGQGNGTGRALYGFGSYAYGCNDTYDIGNSYGTITFYVDASEPDEFYVTWTNLKPAEDDIEPMEKILYKTNWPVSSAIYQCNAPGPNNFLGLAGTWSYEGNDLALCVRNNGGNSGFPYQIITSYRAFDTDVSLDYAGNDLLGYAVYNVLSKDSGWGRYTECYPGDRLFDVGTDGLMFLDDDTVLMSWQSTVAEGPSDSNPFGDLWSGIDWAKRKDGTVPWTCDKFSTCAGKLGPKNPYYPSAASSVSLSLVSVLVTVFLLFLNM